MKKLYIHPEVNVVSINQKNHLLTGSETLVIGTAGSANDAESRSFSSSWDDED